MSNLVPRTLTILVMAAFLFTGHTADAEMKHKHAAPAGACDGIALACAITATPAFAPDGTLWLTWAAGGRISIASSRDDGKSFSPPITLPATELPLDNGPDARPKIVAGAGGSLVVSFAARDDKFNGHAFIARSTDGGKTFSAASPITTNSPSQRFETVATDQDGRAFAAWVDKRNSAAAKAANSPYAGAAIAYAWDTEVQGPLGEAAIARDNSCECCRIAVAFAGPGKPVLLFRNIFDGGIRDHGVITFAGPDKPGPVLRVSDDDWVTDACPHHGPSLAIGPLGTYHATWFALGRKLKGVYYAHSRDGGATFSPPLRLGDQERQISRPFVLAALGKVFLAYKAFDGERTTVEIMTSEDAGETWSKPLLAAETLDDSDHPLLVANGKAAFLSWTTRKEGYRLLPIGGGQ